MLALEVEFLMGRIMASASHNRQKVEWPPHPTRLFSALTAAYKECELGDDARASLEWLEAISEPPSIYAEPPDTNGEGRDVLETFVPVNDSNQLPERRIKQGRYFPAFTPSDPKVWFIWPVEAGDHATTLQHIAENVTYLGHSMSPVRVRVGSAPPDPTLIPDATGTVMLRTPGKGRLRHLEDIHKMRETSASIQPSLGRVTPYSIVGESRIPHPSSIFQHAYTLKLMQGTIFPSENIAMLAGTARKALLNLYPGTIPEIISGHNSLREPLKKPHMAITPLLDAGHRFADGHVLGFAIWLPDNTPSEVFTSLGRALSKLNYLTMGRLGKWDVQYAPSGMMARMAKGLDSSTHSSDYDTWASVTPVVFGKHPKKSQIGPGKDGGKVFAELCEMIGLPKPIEVRLGPTSAFGGIPMASEFIPPSKSSNRLIAHVWLQFGEPVRGPVLLGAGRYNGFGLCRPWGLS